MLDKITFANGTIVSKEYLNEVQKGTSFDATTTRDDYYAATEAEHNSWDISQRDKLKDYELSDPRQEKETAVGRLAHDGIILGYEGTITSVAQATFTKPKTIPITVGQNSIPVIDSSSSNNTTRGVIIEAGSVKLSDGTVFSWPRTLKQLIGVSNSTSGPNYVYVLERSLDTTSPTLAISTELPDISAIPHVPLAKLNFNGFEFQTSAEGQVMGTGVIDLRPNLFIGNLSNYSSASLTNTEIINSSQQISIGDRAIVDTRNGSVIIKLPAGKNSARVAVVDLEGSFDRYPVVLRPDTGSKINGSVDDWIINIRDAHLELFYHEPTDEWKFEETPGSDCNPVLGTFISCGGKEFIGTRTSAECPDGQPIPANYPDPSEGVYRYEASSQKCYKEINSTAAVYSNGEGGLIKVFNAPRCIKSTDSAANTITSISKSIIYVDPSVGNDAIDNTGTDDSSPFRTIERAVLEAARASRRREGLDAYDTTVIELAPGDYYIDNSPGVNAVVGGGGADQYIKQVDTGFGALSDWTRDAPFIIIETSNSGSDQPPISLNLGRTIYTPSGGIGTIYKLEKLSAGSTRWKVFLQYVQGTFSAGDRLLYNRLSDFNPSDGGVIIPRGISVNGVDLRKVRIRPMYVPALTPGQNVAQDKRTYIFKVTGGTYVSLITFTDNQQFSRTHSTVTAIGYASEEEIKGSDIETSYYQKINSLFSAIDGWGSDSVSPVTAETTIVAPLAASKFDRSQDLEQNQTGLQTPDLDLQSATSIPGQAVLKVSEAGSTSYFKLPDVNSTRSSSPYVFNCSVRSIFGLNGMWIDGSRVSGFKSMVSANYTQVSLQTDPNCFETPSTDYYNDPPTNKESGEGKKYKSCSADPFKYRHWGFRASYDAQVQLVSCFVIGNADHFISESGSDLSITNSCSDFGDISLRAIGFKEKAFSQDEGIPTGTYLGTKITEIIPPVPLSYDPLPNGAAPTLVDNIINTSLTLDYEKTLKYVKDNSSGEVQPSTFRIYVGNSNTADPFDLNNPPSCKDIAFGQYTYSKKTENDEYELSGGSTRANRRQLFITGFDENAASIIYTVNIQLQNSGSPGFDSLDNGSKIFAWDANQSSWFVEANTTGIVEEIGDETREDKGDLNGDGYLTKKLDYAFRYKVSTETGDQIINAYKELDFIFDNSPIKIIRGTDQRTDIERVYKVVLEGHQKELGIRRPQAYYILEKQQGVAGYPLNGGKELEDNPLVVTLTVPYDQYINPGKAATDDPQFPDKYVAYIAKSGDARDVFTGDFYPVIDQDHPEVTEDPEESITKIALKAMVERPGVAITGTIAAGVERVYLKTQSNSTSVGFLTSLRRPSVIRASGHTWEWTGYLNYDTSFPTYQGEPLDQDFALGKIIVEEGGGRIYATGMNEEGNYYLGTTVFDLRSGEQFSIPLKADNEPGNVSNQILNNVIIKNNLLLADNSSTVFGKGTEIFFSQDTKFKSLIAGDITASGSESSRMQVYASTSKAGFVQLASAGEVRGAKLLGNRGISTQVVVTAFDLATEFDVRLDNNLSEGEGIKIASTKVNPDGGDPSDPGDDITQFQISVDPEYPGFTPIGGIIMWSGSDADVPVGWAVCNQSTTINGVAVPDLSDRFIVGKSSAKATGTTGGPTLTGSSGGYALKKADIPEHRHGILHSHRDVTITYVDRYLTDANTGPGYDNEDSDDIDGTWTDSTRSTSFDITDANMTTNGEYSNNRYSGNGGDANTQDGPIGDPATGDGKPHFHEFNLTSSDTLEPKWFALAFIIRTK